MVLTSQDGVAVREAAFSENLEDWGVTLGNG